MENLARAAAVPVDARRGRPGRLARGMSCLEQLVAFAVFAVAIIPILGRRFPGASNISPQELENCQIGANGNALPPSSRSESDPWLYVARLSAHPVRLACGTGSPLM